MPNQVDMNAALESFQAAYSKRYIIPVQCQLHNDLWVLKDDANGDTRWTFAQIEASGAVCAIVSVLTAEPYEGR
ncbi:hypothetical protein [Massilia cavernae]|uniref:hypothetical protein n=1 Tax=Massilia cavernae TaxID=2320864 RepID=UPI0011C35EB4|nr:hypothetical protein [Massilia cavernae]